MEASTFCDFLFATVILFLLQIHKPAETHIRASNEIKTIITVKVVELTLIIYVELSLA